MKLTRRLQDPRLGTLRENNPFRMPLQFFKQTTDKTHGLSVAEKRPFRNQKPSRFVAANVSLQHF